MIKKISLFFIFLLPLLAIDLQINPDRNISVTQPEIDQTTAKFLAKKMRIENKDAKNVVYENRLLANELLKTSKIPSELLNDIRLSLEETLAEALVKQHQDAITIDDKVLESYYKTNKKEFEEDRLLDIVVYDFDDFEKATKFYATFKNTPENSGAYIKDNNITASPQQHEIGKLTPMMKDALRDYEQKNYLTTPLFFQKKFYIIYIKDVKHNDKKTFASHREYITTMLKQKTFLDARAALLKKLKETK